MTITHDGWTRSRFSNSQGNCIDAKADPHGPFISVRESRNGPQGVNVPVEDWMVWTREAIAGLREPVDVGGGNVVVIIPCRGRRYVQFDSTKTNWDVFVAGLNVGDFNDVVKEVLDRKRR